MTSTLVAMASNPIAMASNLIVIVLASNLIVIAMASNLRAIAMASNPIRRPTNLEVHYPLAQPFAGLKCGERIAKHPTLGGVPDAIVINSVCQSHFRLC